MRQVALVTITLTAALWCKSTAPVIAEILSGRVESNQADLVAMFPEPKPLKGKVAIVPSPPPPLNGQVPNTHFRLQVCRPLIEANTDAALYVVGVLGVRVEEPTGFILQIYPGSDVARAGIEEGDRITHVDGLPYKPWEFQADVRGIPGDLRHLTIRRKSHEFEADVQLMDSRDVAVYDGYYQNCAEKTRAW